MLNLHATVPFNYLSETRQPPFTMTIYESITQSSECGLSLPGARLVELSLVGLFNSHSHARDASTVNEWEARYGVPVF